MEAPWSCNSETHNGNFWYIPLPSSARQQREMTNFSVAWGTRTTTAICLKSLFRIFAGFHIQFRENFDSDKQTKWLKSIARFEGKIQIHFCNRRCPRRSRLKVNEVWTCLSPGCSKTSDAPCSCTALTSHRNSLYQSLYMSNSNLLGKIRHDCLKTNLAYHPDYQN